MNKSNSLGQLIKKFRLEKGLTQQDLELELNASTGHICRIEQGDINPTKETLLKISEILNLDLKEKLQLFPIINKQETPNIGLIFCGGNYLSNSKDYWNKKYIISINNWMSQIPEVQFIAHVTALSPFLGVCSATINYEIWEKLASLIYKNYTEYDGFIITHGPDGLSYTASIISFMLQSINKPIIFTSSILPIKDNTILYSSFSKYTSIKISRNLAKINVINAVYAAASDIAEVGIVYGNTLLRANRSVLTDYYNDAIYKSMHIPPLATVEFGLEIAPHCLRRSENKLRYFPKLEKRVVCLRLYPGINPCLIENLLNEDIKGIVIEVMGIGSFPPQIIPSLEKACKKGITIVACANKEAKWVDLELFYTGWIGRDAGVIPTRDMTIEAAYGKLMWALAQTSDPSKIQELILTNVAGEISEN